MSDLMVNADTRKDGPSLFSLSDKQLFGDTDHEIYERRTMDLFDVETAERA